jgi:hypothetical protein
MLTHTEMIKKLIADNEEKASKSRARSKMRQREYLNLSTKASFGPVESTPENDITRLEADVSEQGRIA